MANDKMTAAEEKNAAADKKKRLHKATWAKDKRGGGYLIRVAGPTSNRFTGREVPVVKKNDDETMELLEDIVWTGKDDETGQPVTLYRYAQTEQSQDDIPF